MEPDDVARLYEWENDQSVWRHGTTTQPLSRATVKALVDNADLDLYQSRQMRLMIVSRETQETVGCVDVFDYDPFHQHALVAVLVREPFRRKGYAFDAMRTFTEYLFGTFAIHTLCATISGDNEASLRLFEKCGFSHVGTRPQWLCLDGRWHDELIYVLQNE